MRCSRCGHSATDTDRFCCECGMFLREGYVDTRIMAALQAEEIFSLEPGEPSAAIRERVEAARAIQRERFRRSSIESNAEMSSRHIRRWCELDAHSRTLLAGAIERLGLSARAHDRVLKVARTIADLAGAERIDSAHLSEAVQYRALDRAYFRNPS